jgi:hypothetical protein
MLKADAQGQRSLFHIDAHAIVDNLLEQPRKHREYI